MSEENICMWKKNICMWERKYSGNGRSIVEMEGRSFIALWLAEKLGAGSCSGPDQHGRGRWDASMTASHWGIEKYFIVPWNGYIITSLSLERQRTGSSAPSSTVESEMRNLFRPGSSGVSSAGQAAPRGQTGLQQSLQYQTRQLFGNWNSRPRKRWEQRTWQLNSKLSTNIKF